MHELIYPVFSLPFILLFYLGMFGYMYIRLTIGRRRGKYHYSHRHPRYHLVI